MTVSSRPPLGSVIADNSEALQPKGVSHRPPLAAYVHIPWCVKKCPYCDFNSHTSAVGLPETEYVDALIADLDQQLLGGESRPLSSIFFGGGTPSLFSAASLGRILHALEDRLSFAEDVEITLEAGATGNCHDADCSAAYSAGFLLADIAWTEWCLG